ncbi:hypothetical protein A3SI_17092 [Nitritalea halalkaliphila LW7]|uniref:Uncharacterized protein n=1 Tax=Nitritalea halalkaliphila LW7 TaxID=1189621 RepID=I5BWF3_9BACT|nr:hypothetical protein A3SI_17092 [Nitritalea halalkaliphila LW7]
MITLDSISKIFDGKIVVLKNTYNSGELIFLKNNFPSLPEIYPIPEHSYKSFFIENNTFPFYAFTKNNFSEITFFCASCRLPLFK